MKRRTLMQLGALSPIALLSSNSCNSNPEVKSNSLLGKVNHSACRWCYSGIQIEQLAEQGKSIGLKSIELLDLDEIKVIQDYGLTCAIANGSKLGITKGWNDVQNHGQLIQDYTALIPQLAELGIEKVICFSGNKNGISRNDGLENCAKGLEQILPIARKHNVNIVMELLNSKIDHHDYQCDHTDWGVELAEKIGDTHFSLLYDIYHMQIMEGDVIRTIKNHHKYISHYHTGGVPGRNEIDETQELNYQAIIKAIVATGYEGFIAQEFIPTRSNKIESLAQGIKICDV